MTQPHIRLFLIDHTSGISPINGIPVELMHRDISARGYAPHEVIHHIAHGDRRFNSLDSVTSNAVRKISRLRAHHAQHDGRMHVFGMLDQDSSYGNRRVLEHTIRHLSQTTHPFVVHILWDNPTPREYRLALNEIHSSLPSHGTVGSIAPIHLAHSYKDTKKYFDGIVGSSVTPFPHDVPLHDVPHFHDEQIAHPHDSYIFLGTLNPFDRFHQKLRHELGIDMHAIDDNTPTPPWLRQMLDTHHHVLGISNRPHYLTSYAGNIQHPYLETVVNDSSETLLEMLISPHFGYPQDPAHTIVMLDRENTPSFDWLIQSYLKANSNKDFDYFYVPIGRIAPVLLHRMDAATRSIPL